MNRKQVINLFIVAIAVLLLSAVTVALSPVWVVILLINPNIIKPASDRATQAMIRRGAKAMFKNQQTQPMKAAR